jgi:Na+-translocating membrane potential-generating system (MpsC)
MSSVMRGGLTEAEKTMLAGGEEDLVRRWRLRFQELAKDESTAAVERATGREVVDYHSQLLAPSETVVEIFILSPTATLLTESKSGIDGPPVSCFVVRSKGSAGEAAFRERSAAEQASPPRPGGLVARTPSSPSAFRLR